MTNKELEEIEFWIGRHRSTGFSVALTKDDEVVYKTINPNEHIQRLVNKVQRLWSERDSDRRHTDMLAKRIRELNVEIDGGTGEDGVPEQGWKGLVVELKKRVGELEEHHAVFKPHIQRSQGVTGLIRLSQKAEAIQVKLMRENHELKSDLETNATLLAKQTDLAREAELKQCEAENNAAALRENEGLFIDLAAKYRDQAEKFRGQVAVLKAVLDNK